jgi:hypothetical protein
LKEKISKKSNKISGTYSNFYKKSNIFPKKLFNGQKLVIRGKDHPFVPSIHIQRYAPDVPRENGFT